MLEKPEGRSEDSPSTASETPELIFFAMVNSLFSLMLEAEPSNHLHSIVIEKKYLAQAPN